MSDDRCPGVLAPHQAADGAMVRIRVPGGQTTGTALGRLGRVAQRYGSGLLQLTSRGSLQLRGLPEVLPEAFERAVADAGFLPSDSHDRVRNVVCSPLTGLHGGLADLRPMLAELDRSLIAVPALATLSGRFLFGLDDGRGDLTALAPDLGYRALGPDAGLLHVGADRARPVAASDAVPELITLATAFAAARGGPGAWRIADLPGWVDGVSDLGPMPALASEPPAALGRVGAHASVAVPLGLLTPDQLDAVTAVAGSGVVVVTPWRGLVVTGAGDRLDDLLATGLVADLTSPWTAISACVGAPWCSKGLIDTQALVRSVAGLDTTWPRTHVSGCERRCGAPTGEHRDLVAPTRAELLRLTRPLLVTHG